MTSMPRGCGGDDAAIEVRIVEETEVEQWQQAVWAGFLNPFEPGERTTEWARLHFYPGRLLGAWDGARCVGTLGSIPMTLTVPGGATVPTDGVAFVSVVPTHRRRGLLTRLVQHDFTLAHERGDAVALLFAAEHGIYGRFGFGQAIRHGGWAIDVLRSGGLRPGVGELAGGAGIELLTMAELAGIGPELHQRFRITQPGAISRTPSYWRYATGQAVDPGGSFTPPFAAVHREGDGQVTGLLTYEVHRKFRDGDPNGTLTVLDHLATSRAAAAALWRFAFAIDWVRHVKIPSIGVDDPLPRWLVNPRAIQPVGDPSEDGWLRLLDAPAAFAARTFETAGRTVFAVHDEQGWVSGRWLLETAQDGAGTFSRTTAEPELALDAGALGAVYLGGVTVPQLAAAGLVQELRPGAVLRAGRQLRTALEPWCPDSF